MLSSWNLEKGIGCVWQVDKHNVDKKRRATHTEMDSSSRDVSFPMLIRIFASDEWIGISPSGWLRMEAREVALKNCRPC